MSVERIIGIDFGTSTSVIKVKRYNSGQPVDDRLSKQDVIFNGNSPTVPTLIQRTDKGTYYGYDALTSKKGETLFQNFKVDLESSDPVKRQEARSLTEEFFAYMAKEYISQSEGGHFGAPSDTERTIVSYPVKWSDETKDFMVKAAEKAGFKNVEGMDEAQAAIHAVTVQSEDYLTKHGFFTAGVPCNILLIDMGAGTTDLVLCRHTPGNPPKNEMICTWPQGGDTLFGGREVDEILREYIRSLLPEEQADVVLKKNGMKEFKTWKETVVSPTLARNETVEEFSYIDFFVEWSNIKMEPYDLDRDKFEKLAEEYLQQFPRLIAGCIDDSGISNEDIDLIILTGGHSQWYFVKEMLSNGTKVDLPKIHQNPERIISITRPQETVALGMIYRPLSVEFPGALGSVRVIGIDFGTSTSVIRVKRYNNGQPVDDRLSKQDVIFNGDSPMVPTLIQRTEKGIYNKDTFYGYDALMRRKSDSLCQNFKMNLESPDLAQRQESRALTEEFFAYMAREYRFQSENKHFGDTEDIERTIVSYPVKWSAITKEFLIKTAEKAGFKNVEGMDETQAALHAVTLQSKDYIIKNKLITLGVPSNILFIDMGAETTNLVLCRYTFSKFPKYEIISTWPKEGEAIFGGRKIDELLWEYIHSLLPGEQAEIVLKHISTAKEIKQWKEAVVSPALKRNETVEEFSEIDIIVDMLDIDMEPYDLDRDKFEKLAEDYLQEFPKLIADCIDNSGISNEDIDLIILTGGHSQWYFVKEMLSNGAKVDLPKICQNPERIIPITRPQETVALGMVYRPLAVEF